MSEERSNIGFATLKKRISEDRFWQVEPKVQVGQQYMVDLDSRKITHWRNRPTDTLFHCETIEVLQEDGETWKPFPTELLEL